jgi:hypothetical protein
VAINSAWLSLRGQHAYSTGRVTITFELVVIGDNFLVGCAPASSNVSSAQCMFTSTPCPLVASFAHLPHSFMYNDEHV